MPLVFFNNDRTPDGSVRMLGEFAGGRAAIRVAFDELPKEADRLVLVAAVDPATDPSADLEGFTRAGIRLRHAEGGKGYSGGLESLVREFGVDVD